MPTIQRKEAMLWWRHLKYIEQYELIVKHKTCIIGYPDRSPESLSGREIQMIHTKEIHLGLNKS